MNVAPLDASLGAIVTGVRLAEVDDAMWATIEEAFHEHAVLVFPGQHLSSEEQKAFGLRFGPLEFSSPISNTTKEGELLGRDAPPMSILRGNEGWHTDSSYMAVAAKASLLSAHVVPTEGGNTEWADMRAAYEVLPDETKAKLEGLSAFHSIVYSQIRAGEVPLEGSYGVNDGPVPRRPLVKVHPATGRRSLFIGRHAHAIPGMSEVESEELLDSLLREACRPPRIFSHRWQVGDLVVWDNRCVLHRAQPWDWSQPRVMKHTRISGDPVTEAALA